MEKGTILQKPECRSCRFSLQLDNALECRRFPPHANSLYWPKVERDDWCGEHEPVRPPLGEMEQR